MSICFIFIPESHFRPDFVHVITLALFRLNSMCVCVSVCAREERDSVSIFTFVSLLLMRVNKVLARQELAHSQTDFSLVSGLMLALNCRVKTKWRCVAL